MCEEVESIEVESEEVWILKRKHLLNISIKKAQELKENASGSDKLVLERDIMLWRRQFKRLEAETKTHKTCTKCKKNQPIGNFHTYRHSADGKHSHCKTCKSKYQAKHDERKKSKYF